MLTLSGLNTHSQIASETQYVTATQVLVQLGISLSINIPYLLKDEARALITQQSVTR